MGADFLSGDPHAILPCEARLDQGRLRCRYQLPRETPLCYRAPEQLGSIMSVDAVTVRRIAHLARIAVADEEVEHLRGELNAILAFVEQLGEVDVAGVEPMTSVTPMRMKQRPDVVTDGDIADQILRNAPATEGNYFLVPKVVE
jgi:aspartyl-tRNA(Asn)/glutamyl-tRNA(Gln) amidotransferase subunit C